MIIDIKYHIASLVAIFLALGIGILIGTAIIGNDALIKQQNQLAKSLEGQLNQLRQKNEDLQAKVNILETDNSTNKQFEKQVLPLIIGGQLAGKDIAIIETNNYGLQDDLYSAFKLAGANITSVTTIVNGFNLSDEVKGQVLTELGIPANISTDDLVKHLAMIVAQAAAGNSQDLTNLNYLADKGLIKTEGSYNTVPNYLVLIGGSQDQSTVHINTIDYPIIDYFLNQKLPVFGVEHLDVAYSYMKDYQRKRISTVDDVDIVPGQVALILAMAGSPGHYGVKSTAQQLMPAVKPPGEVKQGGQG